MNVEKLIENAQAALNTTGGLWSVHPDPSLGGNIISVRKLRDYVQNKTGRHATVKIAPAMPSFENNPKDINDLADFIAGKVLDLLMNGRE